jgi:hypothetical protein
MSDIVLPSQGFVPRWYQLPLWKYLEAGGKRAAVVWPRRHGKDLLSINWCAVASQQRVGTYWLVYPYLNQGRRIAWTGMDGAGKKFLDAFPEELVSSRQNAEMRLSLKNGSVVQVMGADEPDRFVGANPVGIIFSEWSLMNPLVWKLTAPILAENGGWSIFIYTPRGANHGLDTLNTARTTPGWFHSKLTAADAKVLTAEQLREARKELKDDSLFQQEFFTSFTVPLAGAYYQTQFKYLYRHKRITEVPVDPALPVTTAWDLGVDDEMAIWFAQESPAGEVRMVHYHSGRNEGLGHYIKYLHNWANDHGVTYKEHLAPHDIAVRELTTGKSRLETARSMGIKFRPVSKHSIEDGIEAVRNLLPMCWFDLVGTKDGASCLKSYSKKYDEQTDTYSTRPDHNWASHAADAMRTFAWGRRKAMVKKAKNSRFAQTEYDIFA